MMERSSRGEWLSVAGAIGWGVLLGLIPFSALGALSIVIPAVLGPPVAFLMLRRWPFLSWQLCITAAAFSGAYADRTPEDPSGGLLLLVSSEWFALSLLSLPWPFILRRWAAREREEGRVSNGVSPYIGAGMLLFLAFGLIVFGAVAAVAGIVQPQPVTQASYFDRAASFIGWAMASGGIWLALRLLRRRESRLSAPPAIWFGLLLAFVTLPLGSIALSEIFDHAPCASGGPCTPVRGVDEFWALVIAVECVTALAWLIARVRRDRRPAIRLE